MAVAGAGWAGGVAQRAEGELHGGAGGGAQQVVQHQAHQGGEGRPARQGEQVSMLLSNNINIIENSFPQKYALYSSKIALGTVSFN